MEAGNKKRLEKYCIQGLTCPQGEGCYGTMKELIICASCHRPMRTLREVKDTNQKEYIIIDSSSLENLKKDVEWAMKDGYKCQGGIAFKGEFYFQAMVKEE